MKTHSLPDIQERYRERALSFFRRAAFFRVQTPEERKCGTDGKKLSWKELTEWFENTQVLFISTYNEPSQMVVNFGEDSHNNPNGQVTYYFNIVYEPF